MKSTRGSKLLGEGEAVGCAVNFSGGLASQGEMELGRSGKKGPRRSFLIIFFFFHFAFLFYFEFYI